jgi:hypothetical protein
MATCWSTAPATSVVPAGSSPASSPGQPGYRPGRGRQPGRRSRRAPYRVRSPRRGQRDFRCDDPGGGRGEGLTLGFAAVMGTWDAGVYSNDTACHVRDACHRALENGAGRPGRPTTGPRRVRRRPEPQHLERGTARVAGTGQGPIAARPAGRPGQGAGVGPYRPGPRPCHLEGSDLYGYRRAAHRRLRPQLTAPPPRTGIRRPRQPDPKAIRRLPYQEGSVFQLPLRDGRSARGLVSHLDPGSDPSHDQRQALRWRLGPPPPAPRRRGR